MTTKAHLHKLIDELPETALAAAERYLDSLRAEEDVVLRAFLTAPEDDEEQTEEERAAVREAREAIARGEVIRDEDLDRELGW
jgi:leucyl aminopeptidase (aminopeptidase T)